VAGEVLVRAQTELQQVVAVPVLLQELQTTAALTLVVVVVEMPQALRAATAAPV
jgi:hypothetical protein